MVKTGNVLKEISRSNRETSQIINEIAAATEEQKIGLDQVNKAITELDQMTQQNAALVEEISGLSEEMTGRAKDMKSEISLFRLSM